MTMACHDPAFTCTSSSRNEIRGKIARPKHPLNQAKNLVPLYFMRIESALNQSGRQPLRRAMLSSMAARAAATPADTSSGCPSARIVPPSAVTATTANSGRAVGPMWPMRMSLPSVSPRPEENTTPYRARAAALSAASSMPAGIRTAVVVGDAVRSSAGQRRARSSNSGWRSDRSSRVSASARTSRPSRACRGRRGRG